MVVKKSEFKFEVVLVPCKNSKEIQDERWHQFLEYLADLLVKHHVKEIEQYKEIQK